MIGVSFFVLVFRRNSNSLLDPETALLAFVSRIERNSRIFTSRTTEKQRRQHVQGRRRRTSSHDNVQSDRYILVGPDVMFSMEFNVFIGYVVLGEH